MAPGRREGKYAPKELGWRLLGHGPSAVSPAGRNGRYNQMGSPSRGEDMSRASGRVAALLLLALVGACTPDERAAPTAPVAGMRSVANPPNPPVLFLHYDYMV